MTGSKTRRVPRARTAVGRAALAVCLSLVPGLAAVVLAISCGGEASPRTAARAAAPDPTAAAVAETREGATLVGTPAPRWEQVDPDLAWVGDESPSLQSLGGKVVLVRFWTDTCPFCRASAPALRELDTRYRDRGLQVIGMYHPKPRGTPKTAAQIAEVRKAWQWQFPVALDLDWAVLDRYWLATGRRNFTSVSFLIDRLGTIRYIHPGPEFHSGEASVAELGRGPGGDGDHRQCRDDFAAIEASIAALLAEQ